MTNETLKYICSYGQYIFTFLAAVAAIGNIYFGRLIEQNKVKEEAMSGKLSQVADSSLIDPSRLVGSSHQKNLGDSVQIRLGGWTLYYPKSSLEKGLDIGNIVGVNDSYNHPIVVKQVNGKLLLTTKIFDREGKLVCSIEDNEWSINKNNYYKRNYSSNAVEVIDQYDNVTLSVELINNNEIEVWGIFIVPNVNVSFIYGHTTMIMPADPEYIKKTNIEGKNWDLLYRANASKIPKKFKYGKQSLGQRV